MNQPPNTRKKKSIQDMIDVEYDFSEKSQGAVKKDNIRVVLPREVQQEEKKKYKKVYAPPVQPMLSEDKSTPEKAKEKKEAYEKVANPSTTQLLTEGVGTLPLMYFSDPKKAVGHMLKGTPLGEQLGNFDEDLELIRTLRHRPGTKKEKKEDLKKLNQIERNYAVNAFINGGLFELGYLSPSLKISKNLLKGGSLSNLLGDTLQIYDSVEKEDPVEAGLNALGMLTKLDNFDAANARKLIFNPSSLPKDKKIDAVEDLINLGFAGQQQTQRVNPIEESSAEPPSFAYGGTIQDSGDVPKAQRGVVIKDERLQRVTTKDNTPTPVFNRKQERPLTPEEAKQKQRMLAEQHIAETQGEIKQHTPQSKLSKAKEVALNPLTAFGYVARNEELPDNFSKGDRVVTDYVADFANPAYYVESAKNLAENQAQAFFDLSQGNFGDAALSQTMAGVEALSFLPIAKQAKPFLKKGMQQLENIPTSIAPELRQGLQTNGFLNMFKPKFKSEIDWAKWNKEIPENKALMQEYKAIEQQAKTNGTWMKNPDGSAFQGTPEQFVQQNSENFKKAFGNSKLINPDGSIMNLYHGTPNPLQGDKFDLSYFGKTTDEGWLGKGIYVTPKQYVARNYSKSNPSNKNNPQVYSLYGNSENPISTGNINRENLEKFFGREDDVFFKNNDAVIDDFMGVPGFNSTKKDLQEILIKNPQQLKSAIGNNGMFDMTNPNIYKSILPIGLGLGAATQLGQEETQRVNSTSFAYGGTIGEETSEENIEDFEQDFASMLDEEMIAETFSNANDTDPVKNFGTLIFSPDNKEVKQKFASIHTAKNTKKGCLAGALNCNTDFVSHNLGVAPIRGLISKVKDISKYKVSEYNPTEGINSWEIHDMLEKEKLGTRILKASDNNIYSKDKAGNKIGFPKNFDYKNLPIGTIIGQGEAAGAKTKPSEGSRSRHTWTVVGFDEKDGMPLVYDYGSLRRIESLTGVSGDNFINNVTIPKGYEKYTYSYLTTSIKDKEKKLGLDVKEPVKYNSKKSHILSIEEGVNEIKDKLSFELDVPQKTINKLASFLPGLANQESGINNNEETTKNILVDNFVGNEIIKPLAKNRISAYKKLKNLVKAATVKNPNKKSKQDYQVEIEAYKKFPQDEEKRKEEFNKLKAEYEKKGYSVINTDFRSSVGPFSIKDSPKSFEKLTGLKKEDLYGVTLKNSTELKRGSQAALAHLAESFNKLKKKYPDLKEDQLIQLTLVSYNNSQKVNDPEFIKYYVKDKVLKDNYLEKVSSFNSFAYGTGFEGITIGQKAMKKRMKYANGTNAKGIDPANYIISPAEALNDYNIMLAKAEAKAISNPWLPIVATIGGAAQSFASKAGGGAGGGTGEISTEASAAMGMNNVQQNVEVEGGEMYETPMGDVGEFMGPSHEEGGIPLEVNQDVPEGTKVYSDRLKLGGKTLAERKEIREKKIANLEKLANQGIVDSAIKNAAKRKMEAIQKEEMQDLQFQEQVNNMQAMADTMVMAFGTGMKGMQNYAMGTSAKGMYVNGTDPAGIRKNRFKRNPYTIAENYDGNVIKNFQDALKMDPKTPGYGKVLGPKTEELYGEFAGDYFRKLGYPTATSKTFATSKRYINDGKLQIINEGEAEALGLTREGKKYIGPDVSFLQPKDFSDGIGFTPTQPSFAGEDAFAMTAGEDWAKANPLPEGMSELLPTDIGFTPQYSVADASTKTVKKPGRFGEALKEMSLPGVGDITKLIGNYLGMTSGIKTAAEQRSSDVTHRNVYANAGKESQMLLDRAKQGIEANKAQAMVKASDVSRTGKRGARGSARGVNQMRGLDWLYDTALNQQVAEISANAANQISQIDIQKSGVAMSADQLRGEGQFKANMANEAAKDAYYTALGKGRSQFATGLQQTGKDINAMSQNQMIEDYMQDYGVNVAPGRRGLVAKNRLKNLGITQNAQGKYIGPDGEELTEEQLRDLKLIK